jgi:hypothetical protein
MSVTDYELFYNSLDPRSRKIQTRVLQQNGSDGKKYSIQSISDKILSHLSLDKGTN